MIVLRQVAMVATLGISWCIFFIVRQAQRLHSKFGLSQDDVVSFDDIMHSAAVPDAPLAASDDGDETAVLIPSSNGLQAQVRRGAYDV